MSVSYEALLLAAALGFYLYDSLILLAADELVFARGWRSWRFGAGASLEMRGRYPYLPNPLRPADCLFRVDAAAPRRSAAGSDEELARFLARLAPLRWVVTALSLVLVLGLPLLLFAYRTSDGAILFLCVTYALIAFAAAELFRIRKAIGMPARTAAGLAFEALACPPLALNLARKISLRRGLHADPVRFARRSFDGARFAALVRVLCGRIDEALEWAGDDAELRSRLTAERERLAALAR